MSVRNKRRSRVTYRIVRNPNGLRYDRWMVIEDNRSYVFSTRREAREAVIKWKAADARRREWLDKYAVTRGD